MIFYHFTAIEYLDRILREGLNEGDVPVSETGRENAVWLTTNPDPSRHGLSAGGPLTQAERVAFRKLHGHDAPPDACWPNKRRIRLTADIPSNDIALRCWDDWARLNGVTRKWRRTLDRTAGGGSATWWLYFGTIPASYLAAHDLDTDTPVEGWPLDPLPFIWANR